MTNGFMVPDEMIKAARTAFHDVRLREASSRRAVREWEAEAWRCAVEAAWNRRTPSVTREEIAQAIREEIVRQYRDDERGKCPAGSYFYEEYVSPALIADAILALLRGES